MPPNPKRDRIVILYDLSCKNQDRIRKALLKIYCHYYFRCSKHFVNLILVNSEITKNRLNEKYGKGYERIFEVHRKELKFDDPNFVHDSIQVNNTDGANWKDAIRVALEVLIQDETPNVTTYKILYLTDLSISSKSDDKTDDIVRKLNENDIFLYIVGPSVRFSKTISHFDDLKSLTEIETSSEIDENNFIEAKYIVQNYENAIIANVMVGIQLFFGYCNPIGKQPWTVPLSFGSKIQYHVETMKLIEKFKGFTLRKVNYLKSAKATIFVSMEDSTKKYEYKDVRSGILKHDKFIPLSSNKIFKEELQRTFSLVFITKLKNISEYMMTGPGCYSVRSLTKGPHESFNSLLHKLYELESCLIAKRVYSKNCKPIFMALIPLPSKGCFRAVQLPYGHQVLFEWKENEPPTSENSISEETLSFLESVTVGSQRFALDCPMTPNVMKNSNSDHLLNLATEKLFNEQNMNLDEVTLNPFTTGMGTQIGRTLRDIWPSRGPALVNEVHNEIEDDDSDENYF